MCVCVFALTLSALTSPTLEPSHTSTSTDRAHPSQSEMECHTFGRDQAFRADYPGTNPSGMTLGPLIFIAAMIHGSIQYIPLVGVILNFVTRTLFAVVTLYVAVFVALFIFVILITIL